MLYLVELEFAAHSKCVEIPAAQPIVAAVDADLYLGGHRNVVCPQ